MQYSKAIFQYCFEADYLEDVFFQGLADLGFESFCEQEAYIQTEQLNSALVAEYIDTFNQQFGTSVLLISTERCPDQNWNEAWEAEHQIEELPLGVRIVPHCAFGAGHHETTSMMIDAIIADADSDALSLAGKQVLDNGCGTGVLGIFAAKFGANVIAVDIDDKSVDNTRENAELNGVTIDARLGSTPAEGQFDLILSNIHRNILLEQMSLYARYLKAGGQLFLSGFLEEDVPLLIDSATKHGLTWSQTNARGEWRMIQFKKV